VVGVEQWAEIRRMPDRATGRQATASQPARHHPIGMTTGWRPAHIVGERYPL